MFFSRLHSSSAKRSLPQRARQRQGHEKYERRSPEAATAGAAVYQQKCALCHGPKAQGMANIPSLAKGPTQSVADGELFWFITNGDVPDGMPAWSSLSEKQRWDVVTYLKTINTDQDSGTRGKVQRRRRARKQCNRERTDAESAVPRFPHRKPRHHPQNHRRRFARSLRHKVREQRAASRRRPENAWPKVPEGFKVEQYIGAGLTEPRNIVTAPNGDYFFAESGPGNIKIARGFTSDGKPELVATYATGLNRPYGIAFYPPGPDPKWVYIGETNAVVRFAYKNGDLKASGAPEHIADYPEAAATGRAPSFSRPTARKCMCRWLGLNVDDPDTTPGELNRADVLEFNPDGSGMESTPTAFATGRRRGDRPENRRALVSR